MRPLANTFYREFLKNFKKSDIQNECPIMRLSNHYFIFLTSSDIILLALVSEEVTCQINDKGSSTRSFEYIIHTS